jgi:hypothetical protein
MRARARVDAGRPRPDADLDKGSRASDLCALAGHWREPPNLHPQGREEAENPNGRDRQGSAPKPQLLERTDTASRPPPASPGQQAFRRDCCDMWSRSARGCITVLQRLGVHGVLPVLRGIGVLECRHELFIGMAAGACDGDARFSLRHLITVRARQITSILVDRCPRLESMYSGLAWQRAHSGAIRVRLIGA